MKVFDRLRTTRAFRRRQLAFLQTQEEHDIVLEVGYHQERGTPLTLKRLQLLGLAPIPTLQRRLRHLRQTGAVLARRSAKDARVIELTLSQKLLRTYAKYGKLITSIDGGAARD